MKTAELAKIDKTLPICLIICDDEQEREEGVKAYLKGGHLSLDPDSFQRFKGEVETVPMHRHAVLLRRVDQLKKDQLEQVVSYAERPNPRISLCLTAASLGGKLSKVVEREGVLYMLPKEKPWEREKRLADRLSHEAAEEGVVFPLPIATEFVKAFGTDKILLRRELEKLICYVSERKEISREDIKAVSVPLPQQTFWELADAIFARDFKTAYRVTCGLLQEGMSIFPILSSLRTQAERALNILSLAESGGQSSVQKEYSYLKGRLYEKKMALYRRYGTDCLQMLGQILFKTELEARNSLHEPLFILEKLLIRIT